MTDTVTGRGSHGLRVGTGINQLDNLLGSLRAGENVLWYDAGGRHSHAFCRRFVHHGLSEQGRVVLVSFDMPPVAILRRLQCQGSESNVTVLDCFTYGLGTGNVRKTRDDLESSHGFQCGLTEIHNPNDLDQLVDQISLPISSSPLPPRLVIQGWTGMAHLWDREDSLLDFFMQYCRKIRQMGAVAYWVVDKIEGVKAIQGQLNENAQIVIELFHKQGKAFLVPVKADDRPPQILKQRHNFLVKDDFVTFSYDQRSPGHIDLGRRLREVRMKRGLSQAEIADRIGVSSSTISQIENNLIFPSLSNFLEIADMLRVDPSFLLKGDGYYDEREVVLPLSKAIDVTPGSLPKGSVTVRSYTREYSDSRAELFVIEISGDVALNSHFFKHKGEEIGCLLSGRLLFRLGGRDFQLRPGDVVRFVSEIPDQWENPSPSKATLFWAKIR